MPKRLFGLLGLVLLLAACNGGGGGDQSVSPQTNLIDWDRNPNTVIFRSDVTGGSTDPFLRSSEIPACTIYGDNHIVWTVELGSFNTQVLEDRPSNDQINTFVNFLALNKQIYNYKARANVEPATSNPPVVETLRLFVNGLDHVTDAFSGWDAQYYQDVTQSCRAISTAPALYAPTVGWISAKVVEYNTNASSLLWDAPANGLDLAALAAEGKARWVTDRNVPVIWNVLRTSPADIQFTQDNISYWVSLQIPNITRDAPAAP